MTEQSKAFRDYLEQLKNNAIPSPTGNHTFGAESYAMDDRDCADLADILEGDANLTRLFIRSSSANFRPAEVVRHRFTDAGAVKLANALKRNETLVRFEITEADISDEAAMAFAEMLRENRTLAKLDFTGCKITDKGAKALMDACESSPTLLELNLKGNPLGEETEKREAALMKSPKGERLLRPIYDYSAWHEQTEANKERADDYWSQIRPPLEEVPPEAVYELAQERQFYEQYLLLYRAPHVPPFHKEEGVTMGRFNQLTTWLDSLPKIDVSKPLSPEILQGEEGKPSPLDNPLTWAQWDAVMENLQAQGSVLREDVLVTPDSKEPTPLLAKIAKHGKAHTVFTEKNWKGASPAELRTVYNALPKEARSQVNITALTILLKRSEMGQQSSQHGRA